MFKWEKKGLVFEPKNGPSWMKTHAQVPTILDAGDCWRVYFSSRPEKTLSLTGYVDLDKKDPTKVLYVHEKSIIPQGRPGTFDEFGIMPSTLVKNPDGSIFMYYTGWSRGTTVPYLNAIGLAVSTDNGKTFSKYSEGPVVERRMHEPFSAMSPYVLFENNKWHMWYSSGVDWHQSAVKLEPIYIIKYAHSTNGVDWNQTGFVSILPRFPLEAATRATVLKIKDQYCMWYCYRGSENYRAAGDTAYRIGFATSKDAVNWDRKDDQAGINVSASGWDSQMIEYPQIVQNGNELLMFYNGNGFGEDGFGIATAKL